jgi:hypothetical protein
LLTRNATVIDQLDNVDTADLADTSLDDLEMIIEREAILLSQEILLSEGLTDREKALEIRGLMLSVRTLHQNILTARETLRTDATALRTTIQDFRASGLELSETDKATLQSSIAELKEIRTALGNTLGLAYKQLHDLRGKYTRENLDLIHNTYQNVEVVLQLRYDKIIRIDEIVVTLQTMLITAMGELDANTD